MIKRGKLVLSLVILLLVTLALPVGAEKEREDGYFTLVDEKGETICRTAHEVKKVIST